MKPVPRLFMTHGPGIPPQCRRPFAGRGARFACRHARGPARPVDPAASSADRRRGGGAGRGRPPPSRDPRGPGPPGAAPSPPQRPPPAHYRHWRSLAPGEPPLPLRVDWPFAASYARKRRRGRIAALVVIPVLLAGAGFAAWQYAGEDMTAATNDAPPRSQIEIPLPPQSPGDRAAGQPAASSPPPVPAAPPIIMAQKPYAPPPPTPTPVEPLPQVAATTPLN